MRFGIFTINSLKCNWGTKEYNNALKTSGTAKVAVRKLYIHVCSQLEKRWCLISRYYNRQLKSENSRRFNSKIKREASVECNKN